jgi:hypothetical protein
MLPQFRGRFDNPETASQAWTGMAAGISRILSSVAIAGAARSIAPCLSAKSDISRAEAAGSRFLILEYYKIFAALPYGKKG